MLQEPAYPTPKNPMEGPLTTVNVAGPSWTKNDPIYEVNLDAYKFPAGTASREFEKHLPVLKEMGVGLLWFMRLHPRGQEKAKTPNSLYAVRDYRAINPDYGTPDDFRHLVNRAPETELHVLMDWIANHSAWDNALLKEHPDFYHKNEQKGSRCPRSAQKHLGVQPPKSHPRNDEGVLAYDDAHKSWIFGLGLWRTKR